MDQVWIVDKLFCQSWVWGCLTKRGCCVGMAIYVLVRSIFCNNCDVCIDKSCVFLVGVGMSEVYMLEESGWKNASLWNPDFELALCKCCVSKSCISFASIDEYQSVECLFTTPVSMEFCVSMICCMQFINLCLVLPGFDLYFWVYWYNYSFLVSVI